MIDKMKPEEKSVVLARLCGWHVERTGSDIWVSNSENDYLFKIRLSGPGYLYNYKWMFLAWRVLNWACENFSTNDYIDIVRWFWGSQNFRVPPAEAQTAWLDKILSLAIEAGMVNDEN